MNSVCANCQNKRTFFHEFSIQYCSIIYPTRLRDEQKTALPQGESCSINCVLPACKRVKQQTNGSWSFWNSTQKQQQILYLLGLKKFGSPVLSIMPSTKQKQKQNSY